MRVLSFAIPVFNEEEVLPHLMSSLLALREALVHWQCQFVFVNDGSGDSSASILDDFAWSVENCIVVHLSRNFGQQAAYSAALSYVTGDAVVMMDADLQDDPQQVLALLEEFEKGFDVVYGVRNSRECGPWMNYAYQCFYRLLRLISVIDVPADTGDFCVMSARVAHLLKDLPEVHRYLRGMRAWVGFKQKGVLLDRRERKAGVSKYSFRKLCRLALDGIFSFSLWPLRLSLLCGLVVVLLAGLFMLRTLVLWLFTDSMPIGYPTLIGFLIMLSGVQFFLLGIIGEYVGRVFQQVKARPFFVVDRVVQGDERRE